LEEEVMDGRITFALNIYKDICSIHKPGGAPLSQATFAQYFTHLSFFLIKND